MFFQSGGCSIKSAAETIKSSFSPTQAPFSKLPAWHGHGGRCGWHGLGSGEVFKAAAFDQLLKFHAMAGQKGKPQGKRAPIDLALAKKLEDTQLARELLRDTGGLIRWLSKEKTNVISLETLALNCGIMKVFFEHICATNDVPKSPGINYVKAQDRI